MAGFLITPQGARHRMGGEQHNIYCRRAFKVSLKTFLAKGGVRVKVFRDCVAIESGTVLSNTQKRLLRRVLKQDNYYSMTVCIGGRWANKETMRPIRSM